MQESTHSKSDTPSPPVILFPSVDAQVSRLPNGLEIIIQEDHSAPVASVQFWVETGSIHEGQFLGAGISHMLEHMLFKGTDTLSCSEFAQRVQDAGGYINAYTSFDRTVYWIDIPAKGVMTALELLSDAVLHSTIPAEEFVKEQEVIRREFAMGFDDPDRMSSAALFATAYRTHPYAHPVIGHLELFNTVTREDVAAYYKARYVPNNMFVIVTGAVDATQVKSRIAELFEKTPRAILPPSYIPTEPAQLGRRVSHTEFATELTRLHIAWHIPGISHPDIPVLDVLATILGHGRSARLYRSLRERLRLVHSVDAWCYSPSQTGLWGIDAILDPEHREKVQAAALAMLAELHASGVSEEELGKARRQSLSHQLQAVTTMRGRASDLGSNWLISRNLDFSRDYLASIQRVTSADIQRVIGTYLTGKNLTVISLNPEGSLAASASAETKRLSDDIQKFELSNGLRLLVREDARLPLVSIASTFKAGLLAETAETSGITRLLAKVLLKGTESRSADALADELEAVGGAISADGGNNSLSIFVRVLQPDLALGIDILADVLCHATLPQEAIDREREIQFASIKAEEEEMTSVTRNLLRSNLFGGHPYGLRALGTPESVASLTRDQLAAFRTQCIAAKNGVIAVFGDVKAQEVKRLVEKALNCMEPGEPAFLDLPRPIPQTAPVRVEAFKDKTQAVLMAGFLGADIFSPDRAALELIDEASSDLGSRFFIRIREEMGLAYFVGSSNMPGLVPGAFVFYLGTDPMKVTAVEAELMEEIRKLASEGLTKDELARAKEKLIGQQDIRNQSNDAFAFAAALDELYGLGFDHFRDLRQEVEAVTLEDVRQVAQKYFLNQHPVIAIVRPN